VLRPLSVAPKSFVPETTTEQPKNKGETPEHIASKFKAVGGEKCASCGKNVYAPASVVVRRPAAAVMADSRQLPRRPRYKS